MESQIFSAIFFLTLYYVLKQCYSFGPWDTPQSQGKEGLDFHVEQKGSELLPVSSSPRGPIRDGAQLGRDRCGLGLMEHIWAQRGGGPSRNTHVCR